MQKLISLVLVLFAAGALAAWASGSPVKHRGAPAAGVAAVADASSSWAEFSSKVPNVQDALTRESRQAGLARATRR
jgi:hypothetical protein